MLSRIDLLHTILLTQRKLFSRLWNEQGYAWPCVIIPNVILLSLILLIVILLTFSAVCHSVSFAHLCVIVLRVILLSVFYLFVNLPSAFKLNSVESLFCRKLSRSPQSPAKLRLFVFLIKVQPLPLQVVFLDTPGIDFMKSFSSSLTVRQNKLECLSPADLAGKPSLQTKEGTVKLEKNLAGDKILALIVLLLETTNRKIYNIDNRRRDQRRGREVQPRGEPFDRSGCGLSWFRPHHRCAGRKL